MTVEFACKDAVVHFNKKFLEDPSIPMWVLKSSGKTFYVNHITCNVNWSTKETADNVHTKGSIKVKRALIQINDDNEATINPLTSDDEQRLKGNLEPTRIILANRKAEIRAYLIDNEIEHGEVKKIFGSCGSSLEIVELGNKSDIMQLSLVYSGWFRVLQPNEDYYKAYDDESLRNTLTANGFSYGEMKAEEEYDDDDDDWYDWDDEAIEE